MFSSKRSELVLMFILQRRVFPFPLRFEEECEGVAADINIKSQRNEAFGHVDLITLYVDSL